MMRIVLKTKKNKLGEHYQLEEVKPGLFWVATYEQNEFTDATTATARYGIARKEFDRRRFSKRVK